MGLIMAFTLTELYIYPVKSCRGIALSTARLNDWGLEFDRNWMVVDAAGKGVTQREVPRMALIEPSITADRLCLNAPGQSELSLSTLSMTPTAVQCTVDIWGERCLALDQGEAAAHWFSQVLGQDCRLVRIGAGYNRPVESTAAQVSFADAYPLLLISEASLADLNQRLPAPLPMNRFRPNLVISGCEAYAEDRWQQIQIDQVVLDIVKPCVRCVITTTDQATGTPIGKEPLKTLATYRRQSGGVIFGQNVVHRNQGELQVGCPIEVLQSK